MLTHIADITPCTCAVSRHVIARASVVALAFLSTLVTVEVGGARRVTVRAYPPGLALAGSGHVVTSGAILT